MFIVYMYAYRYVCGLLHIYIVCIVMIFFSHMLQFLKSYSVVSVVTNKVPSVGYVSSSIFTEEEENILCEYLLICAAIYYRLTTKETRNLAYTVSKKYNKIFPALCEKKREDRGSVAQAIYATTSQFIFKITSEPRRKNLTKSKINQESCDAGSSLCFCRFSQTP